MQELVDLMQSSFSMSAGSAGLTAVFCACIFALWKFKFDKRNDIKFLFWYSMVLLVIIINPLYIWIIEKYIPILAHNNMYLWTLPVVPVIMYVVVIAITKLDTKAKKITFITGFAIIGLLATATSYSPDRIKLVENSRYVSSKNIAIYEKLISYVEDNNKDHIIILGPDEIMKEARVYDGRLYTLYGKDLYEGQINPEFRQIYDDWDGYIYSKYYLNTDITDVIDVLVQKNVYAIILKTDSFTEERADNLSNTYILDFENEDYCIYIRKNSKNG